MSTSRRFFLDFDITTTEKYIGYVPPLKQFLQDRRYIIVLTAQTSVADLCNLIYFPSHVTEIWVGDVSPTVIAKLPHNFQECMLLESVTVMAMYAIPQSIKVVYICSFLSKQVIASIPMCIRMIVINNSQLNAQIIASMFELYAEIFRNHQPPTIYVPFLDQVANLDPYFSRTHIFGEIKKRVTLNEYLLIPQETVNLDKKLAEIHALKHQINTLNTIIMELIKLPLEVQILKEQYQELRMELERAPNTTLGKKRRSDEELSEIFAPSNGNIERSTNAEQEPKRQKRVVEKTHVTGGEEAKSHLSPLVQHSITRESPFLHNFSHFTAATQPRPLQGLVLPDNPSKIKNKSFIKVFSSS